MYFTLDLTDWSEPEFVRETQISLTVAHGISTGTTDIYRFSITEVDCGIRFHEIENPLTLLIMHTSVDTRQVWLFEINSGTPNGCKSNDKSVIKLNGPATDSMVDINELTWANEFGIFGLIIDIEYLQPEEIQAIQGRYEGELHRSEPGYSSIRDHTFNLVLCMINVPEENFSPNSQPPFETEIDANTGLNFGEDWLAIELSEVLLTDDQLCGKLVITARTSSDSDSTFNAFAKDV